MNIVIRMGRLIHKLQKERDMTILYIGKLGPGTKAFLLKNYEETDEAFSVRYLFIYLFEVLFIELSPATFPVNV